MNIYAVRNREGKWLRRKGYGGYGDVWTDDFSRVRLYTNIKPARARVTYFFKRWPGFGAADIVVFELTEVGVIGELHRVEKIVADEERAERTAEVRTMIRDRNRLDRQIRESKEKEND